MVIPILLGDLFALRSRSSTKGKKSDVMDDVALDEKRLKERRQPRTLVPHPAHTNMLPAVTNASIRFVCSSQTSGTTAIHDSNEKEMSYQHATGS